MKLFLVFGLSMMCLLSTAQVKDTLPSNGKGDVQTKVTVDGRVYPAIITEQGDTMILVDIDDISVTSLRKFANDEEYKNTRNSGDTLLRYFLMPRRPSAFSGRQNMHRNTYLKGT